MSPMAAQVEPQSFGHNMSMLDNNLNFNLNSFMNQLGGQQNTSGPDNSRNNTPE